MLYGGQCNINVLKRREVSSTAFVAEENISFQDETQEGKSYKLLAVSFFPLGKKVTCKTGEDSRKLGMDWASC